MFPKKITKSDLQNLEYASLIINDGSYDGRKVTYEGKSASIDDISAAVRSLAEKAMKEGAVEALIRFQAVKQNLMNKENALLGSQKGFLAKFKHSRFQNKLKNMEARINKHIESEQKQLKELVKKMNKNYKKDYTEVQWLQKIDECSDVKLKGLFLSLTRDLAKKDKIKQSEPLSKQQQQMFGLD